MAKINVTMDDWIYERIMRSKPKNKTKAEWMRQLAVERLLQIQDLEKPPEITVEANNVPRQIPTNLGEVSELTVDSTHNPGMFIHDALGTVWVGLPQGRPVLPWSGQDEL